MGARGAETSAALLRERESLASARAGLAQPLVERRPPGAKGRRLKAMRGGRVVGCTMPPQKVTTSPAGVWAPSSPEAAPSPLAHARAVAWEGREVGEVVVRA